MTSVTAYVFGGFIICFLIVIAIWQNNEILDNALSKQQNQDLMTALEPEPIDLILPRNVDSMNEKEEEQTTKSIILYILDTLSDILSWNNLQAMFSSLKYLTFFTFIIISSSFILII